VRPTGFGALCRERKVAETLKLHNQRKIKSTSFKVKVKGQGSTGRLMRSPKMRHTVSFEWEGLRT